LKLLFQTAGEEGETWRDALARALPDAKIVAWPTPHPIAVDYALVWRPPAALLAGLSGAKAIFNLGAGVDALMAMPERPRGVPVIRLEDAGMAQQMAEYVVHAVLRRYREFDAYAQGQRNALWEPRPRLRKDEFGVGILGLGVLGAAVATALAAFGFPLAGWSRTPRSIGGVRAFAGISELTRFLSLTRVLVCLLPLTPETRGLLNRATLSKLPRGAYIVNVSRGAVVDDDALLALIDAGHLAGAMLDVFRDEPLAASHAFWHHPRVIVTPHISAVTQIDDSVAQVADKISRLEAGLPVGGIVDDARMY
jgi:glyoxylate/hydroxypyruvate reductase A